MNAAWAFRQSAAASGARRAAFSEFEQTVSVWDLDPPRHVATFPTILDFGGARLALSHDGATVVCAAYHREGVAAYSAETGELLWQRRDIKRPQRISASTRGQVAYVATDDGLCAVVSLDTGEVTHTLRGVRWIVESPFSRLFFVDQSRPAVTDAKFKTLVAVQRTTFAFLDVAFGPKSFAVAESGGPVTCIDLDSGRKQWTHAPVGGVHCLALTYSEPLAAFAGVLWPFENGGPKELVTFDQRGSPTVLKNLGDSSWDECFCQRGSTLLTSDGSVVSLPSGLVTRLPRPPA